MKSWNISTLDLKAHSPQVLSSTADARAIALAIPAGESLADHQVHERAWVSVLVGEVEITTPAGERLTGGPGLVVEFDPPSATPSKPSWMHACFCCSRRGLERDTPERCLSPTKPTPASTRSSIDTARSSRTRSASPRR